jgi:hypothetical protein
MPAAPVGFGLDMTDHDAPFQRSTSVFIADEVSYQPTAKQLLVPGHDTPFNALRVAFSGFGLATTDHAVPFQRCTNVLFAPKELLVESPTPTQFVVDAHDTPLRKLDTTLAPETTDHDGDAPAAAGTLTTSVVNSIATATYPARPKRPPGTTER